MSKKMPNNTPDFLPKGRCLCTLQPTRAGFHYSASALRQLWSGRKVRPVLDFRKEDFLTIQRETAGSISISGVQDKISLRLVRNKLVLTETRGDYILKPVPLANYPMFTADIPANEHLSMQLASQVFGIRTAVNGLVYFADGEPAYITRRFDRDEGGLPLAQEDFCQLSGRSPDTAGPNYKYDSSYEEAGQILHRFSPSYRIDVEKLFRTIVFNYVIGNGDAHLKNFSLLETPFGDFSMSPAYDLLATGIHLPEETRAALALFDGDFETESYRRNAYYKRPDFIELAMRFGIREERALGDLSVFDQKKDAAAAMVERSMLSQEAKSAYLALYEDRSKAIRSD